MTKILSILALVALTASPAFAGGPDLAAMTQQLNPAPAPAKESVPLRIAMYALQFADAANSANAERHGAHELIPLMRPFSHGGIPTFVLGFATEDLIRGALTRRASAGTKNTLNAVQMGLNTSGIIFTDASTTHKPSAFCDPANPGPTGGKPC